MLVVQGEGMVSFGRRVVQAVLAVFVVLCGVTCQLDAQQVFGRIFGTVTDATGGAVSNAKVTITDQNKGTDFDVTTNESGNYEKGQLIPGTYTVTVEAPGFNKYKRPDVTVQVDNAAKVDVPLQAGNVSEVV